MKTKFLRALIVLSAFAMAVMPMQAETHHCSNAAAAGQWAYTYTGSIFDSERLGACRIGRPLSPGCSGQHHRKPSPHCGWKRRGGGHLGNDHC